jgi:hypothetical protein
MTSRIHPKPELIPPQLSNAFTVSVTKQQRISSAIGQLVLLIGRLMAAVRALKGGTALWELGLRGEILVHQCVFNLRVPEGVVTVGAFEVP